MTPQQYLVSQLSPILQGNNPGADSSEVAQLAMELAGLWANLILPNLSVNLTTGVVTFNVPSS